MKGKRLLTELERLKDSVVYPFHMPGHKRRITNFKDSYKIDITEIEGFDNLHHAEGILKEAMERSAILYGSESSYFLVNGSTGGILSAISASCKRGARIIMDRSSHKAAYHGVFLNELKVDYVYPQFVPEYQCNGGLDPRSIEKMLIEHPEIQMVFITSPTYEGIVSDVKSIADCVHRYNIPLIVDEAHGAHFRYSDMFPVSALDLGADVVIQSLHKTLPSLTQSAILHLNSSFIDRRALEQYLQIYQTSSPSYLLMASIDECIRWMAGNGKKEMKNFESMLKEFRNKCSKLKNIRILDNNLIKKYGIFDMDQSKIFLSVKGTAMNGKMLQNLLLEKYQIQLEMCGISHVLAMGTIGDTPDGYKRLWTALKEIDDIIVESPCLSGGMDYVYPEVRMDIYEAMTSEKEKIPFIECQNKISAEFIYAYPPGIPILVPGERISSEIIAVVNRHREAGISLQGMGDKSLSELEIVAE